VAQGLEKARAERKEGLALIRAAGGVVCRHGRDGVEVVLVHRPRYDDWTFPKGKANPGESDEDCALREVEEETGLRCELAEELARTVYRDSKDREKIVRYWRMCVVGGSLDPQNEVDAAEWLTVEEATKRLSYERDLVVLDALRERVP
jgi:8-oxo-dGTP pyrophosphatase MutT (NUDIX family)